MAFTSKINRTNLQTPVLFLIFNRPEETARSLAILREVRPERLYVVSDGPRTQVEGEAERVQACRSMIEQIDWRCEVRKNYARHNLNCGIRPASGLHWIFRHEPKAIIVEDDLLPDLSFFSFCEAMLAKYESRHEVMHISGRNNLGEWAGEDTYMFSRTINPWGWASWARAWKHYRFPYRYWNTQTGALYRQILQDPDLAAFHDYNEGNCQGRMLDTWDIQWIYSIYRNRGLSIVPSLNLVQNTGFHAQGTHTHNDFDMRANLPAYRLQEPYRHPKTVAYENQGLQFDRQNFLLEQLTGFKNPPVLTTIFRLWQAQGGDSPLLRERYKDVIPYLYPLKYKHECREILLRLRTHLPENGFLEHLLKYF